MFVRRGRHHVENVAEHSKCAISTMWCGNAIRQLLPPMVVCRARNIYEEWKANGIPDAAYSCSKRGWFDTDTFKQWFEEVFIPHAERREGIKILFGDNLASHFNRDVAWLANEHQIYFVMLPANETHLFQPLDVSTFGPMKVKWRTELQNWQKESRIRATLPKEHFPMLLRRLEKACAPTIGKNLTSGFHACGLYPPFDRQKVLEKLPTSLDVNRLIVSMNETLIYLLQENWKTCPGKRKREKKAKPGVILDANELEKQMEEAIGKTNGRGHCKTEQDNEKKEIHHQRFNQSVANCRTVNSSGDTKVDKISSEIAFL